MKPVIPVAKSRELFRAVLKMVPLLFVFVLAAAPIFATSQTYVQRYPLPSGGKFVLDNVNGSVQVDGWEREEVEIHAVKTADTDDRELPRVNIEVESQPGQVAVHTRYPQGESVAVAVEYHIHVPYRVLLGSVETVNGSVSVHGVEGSGELRSVNGNVDVSDSSGRFSAHTTNGNIRLQLKHLFDGAPMTVDTVNGSVVLGLPHEAHADLRVSSMNGDFDSELPVASQSSYAHTLRAFRCKLGAGGGLIFLRTVNGGIRLLAEQSGM